MCTHLFMLNIFILALYLILSSVNAHAVAEYAFNFSGTQSTASSYYNFKPNKMLDTQFLPNRAIDGVKMASSWWSDGDEVSKVYWQLKMTSPPPTLTRMIIRWHGFLMPTSYRIRVSYGGQNFQTIAVITNKSIEYDRTDEITSDFVNIPSLYYHLRIIMDHPNICMDASTCSGPSISRYKNALVDHITPERIIYGIREIELWVAHPMTSKAKSSNLFALEASIALGIFIVLYLA
uniref:Uncharacterized protein AlNc14C196G8562 n=1 Tax=Albugo laibachii Nc14 TaxID=890382 RepID=F0WQ81_9STRA|nr:conserved hypothetical protein [Albugo laibachii Nc14]|eukprot:CCA23487.1 conserved hypothetical protein [Albugo laibachii Nc14]